MARKKSRPAFPPGRGYLPPRPGLVLSALAVICLAAGCKEDVISRYKVPKGQIPQRLLGAIIRHDDRTWFFKLVGPEATLDSHEKEFKDFIHSVHFTDKADEPITWKVPPEWRVKEGPDKFRYKTFLLGPKAAPLELIVSPLGAEAGSVLANVNRWRGQMGLPDVDEAELGKLTQATTVDGKPAMLVDLKPEVAAAPIERP